MSRRIGLGNILAFLSPINAGTVFLGAISRLVRLVVCTLLWTFHWGREA